MPTAASSVRRSVADVGHLLRFQASGRRRPAVVALAVVTAVTLVAALAPALVPGAGGEGTARDLMDALPVALAGFVLLAVLSAGASGGGRELIARDATAVFPVSPTTDHLGALLIAPLNIAWILQAWALLGMTAYAVGAAALVPAQVLVVLWLVAGTAFAQAVGWALESVRRTAHGPLAVRALAVAAAAAALVVQAGGRTGEVLDALPTHGFVVLLADGLTTRWVVAVVVALVAVAALVAVGAWPAHVAARRSPRDELRVESAQYRARALPTSELGAMVRLDRASVWRAVPIRRGLVVLALGPAMVALLGGLQWDSMTILPGLVASGGALLYGVNAWCLDGRGTLWRESLPVEPATVFDARAWVLAELLLAASLVTVCVGGLRAGVPDAGDAAAMTCTLAVVVVQVVAAAMRWSQRRPFAVDLRSARATPAPPAAMIGYSSRLALTTTTTGLLFSTAALLGPWFVSPLLAVPMLAWSGLRLRRTRRAWLDPDRRVTVTMTVAAA